MRAVRAMARLGDPPMTNRWITTARLRGEIVVAVPRGDGSVETPYTGSLWRWNLARDRITRLGERVGGEWETRVYESSFGVIIEDNASSQASTTRVYDGHADIDEGEARSDDPSVITASVGDLIIVDGTTYEFSGEREEITVLQRDGDAVVREPFVDLGRSAPDALLLLGTRGHPWVGRIYLRERPVRLEWVMLPSREKRTLTFDGLTGTVAESSVDNTLYVYDETHTHRVDLATGAILPGVTKKTFGAYTAGEPVRFDRHPDTKRRFADLVVPWFTEGRALALKAHTLLAPEALSLGWDVALAEGAPVLLEVNVWTTCYDYDPPDDALTPACALVANALAGSNAAPGAVVSAAP